MDLYDQCRLYDLAFSYRDIPLEVQVLEAWYARAGVPGSSRRVLELAAGPAAHALELARRGWTAAGLDLSPAMCTYARERARAEGVHLETCCADMTSFELDTRFDLALLMLSSAGHLLSLDAMVDHLTAVGRHLRTGGIYILELAHPSDMFGLRSTTKSDWQIAGDGIELEVTWGAKEDPFDPLTQISTTSVTLRARENGREHTLVDQLRLRAWTATEIEAAVRLCGMFDLVEQHGAFKVDAPLDDSDISWRMILVLRKRERTVSSR